MTGQVVKRGFLDCQVCVPSNWADAQVIEFAEKENPCGTENGWQIRRGGDKALAGQAERVSCASRPGHVHMMLDA